MLKRTSTRPAAPTVVAFEGANGHKPFRPGPLGQVGRTDHPVVSGDLGSVPASTLAMAAEALNPDARDFSQDPDAMAAAIAGLDPEDPANAGQLDQIAEGIASALLDAEAKVDAAQASAADSEGDADAATTAPPVAPASVDLGAQGLAELSALLGLSADVIPQVPDEDDTNGAPDKA